MHWKRHAARDLFSFSTVFRSVSPTILRFYVYNWVVLCWRTCVVSDLTITQIAVSNQNRKALTAFRKPEWEYIDLQVRSLLCLLSLVTLTKELVFSCFQIEDNLFSRFRLQLQNNRPLVTETFLRHWWRYQTHGSRDKAKTFKINVNFSNFAGGLEAIRFLCIPIKSLKTQHS